MATPAPIVLILGAGARVGAAVARTFARNGYKVAVASRSGTSPSPDYLALQADFADPSSIPPLFAAVRAEFNAAPSVVVYNAANYTAPLDDASALSIPVGGVVADLNVNTVSPYVAAQQAVLGWETLPREAKKTFIFTGNILNTLVFPLPALLSLGVGKAASAYWIGVADATYKAKGYRFFYADERKPDGKSKGPNVDGPAHGEFYAQLAAHEGNVPWEATFVTGKGYVEFKRIRTSL